MRTSYELGPIRPPSEALSLLLRVTRNCPWNRCTFCAVYKGAQFERRTEQEVMEDIDVMARAADELRDLSWRQGLGGDVPYEIVHAVLRSPDHDEGFKRVALWLHHGGRNVFLQDADSMCIRPDRLGRIVEHLKMRFPTIDRITTYARSRTLAQRALPHLKALREAGITRVHVGLESGCDPLLDLIRKGARAEHHVAGGRKAIEAGFELSCYVMPGLGGRQYSARHARDSAAVLRQIDPHFIRLRSFFVEPRSPMVELIQRGDISLLPEPEVVREIRELVSGLYGLHGRLASDHEMNLLMEVEGDLSRGPEPILSVIDRFLALPPRDQDAFVAARRSGLYQRVI